MRHQPLQLVSFRAGRGAVSRTQLQNDVCVAAFGWNVSVGVPIVRVELNRSFADVLEYKSTLAVRGYLGVGLSIAVKIYV